MKRALITGVTGQDGSFLAEHLLGLGYEVFGMIRRLSSPNLVYISPLQKDPNFHIVSGDMTDPVSLRSLIRRHGPDEVYNLAAMSFVATSWAQPDLTQQINFLGFLHLLEAVRDFNPEIKVYQASTSEMFGNVPPPQNETSIMVPHSPYGVAKLAAHRMAQVYRDSYGMFIACGILFNHESSRRGIEFLTRKVARGVAQIKMGEADQLRLGNLDASRDWGYAGDYIIAMHAMLQQDQPDDFVIGTGISHSVRDFVSLAFESVDLNYRDYVVRDERFVRPADIKELRADSAKAKRVLNWEPFITFDQLVSMMVAAELAEARS